MEKRPAESNSDEVQNNREGERFLQLEIDKESPLPLYHQIKEAFKEKMESGTFAPHQRLPSERELEEELDVSRMTARQALSELESEGYVYRKQGTGSFVAEPKMRHALLKLTSFSEEMKSRGFEPGAKVLDAEVIGPREDLLNATGADPEENFFRLQRLRLADGEPLAIETSHIRTRFCPGIEEFNFQNSSLYETLKRKYDIDLTRAEQTVEATLADSFEAKKLGIKKKAPLLTVEQTTYMHKKNRGEEKAIEFTRAVHRGDRYKLFVDLKR